jgi:hypothetical protein
MGKTRTERQPICNRRDGPRIGYAQGVQEEAQALVLRLLTRRIGAVTIRLKYSMKSLYLLTLHRQPQIHR